MLNRLSRIQRKEDFNQKVKSTRECRNGKITRFYICLLMLSADYGLLLHQWNSDINRISSCHEILYFSPDVIFVYFKY